MKCSDQRLDGKLELCLPVIKMESGNFSRISKIFLAQHCYNIKYLTEIKCAVFS
jgi:hypothetical protein